MIAIYPPQTQNPCFHVDNSSSSNVAMMGVIDSFNHTSQLFNKILLHFHGIIDQFNTASGDFWPTKSTVRLSPSIKNNGFYDF